MSVYDMTFVFGHCCHCVIISSIVSIIGFNSSLLVSDLMDILLNFITVKSSPDR